MRGSEVDHQAGWRGNGQLEWSDTSEKVETELVLIVEEGQEGSTINTSSVVIRMGCDKVDKKMLTLAVKIVNYV